MWDFNYSSASEIKKILEENSLAMSKKFGQNFLLSESAREFIVSSLEIESTDTVFEIGPGLGAITALIIKKAKDVYSFEIDNGFCSLLNKAFKDEENFHLVPGDALKTLFSINVKPSLIAGNLPYNVGSIIIARLIENDITSRRMVFTLQKEVVERMVAKNKSSSYSSFSILCQMDYEVSLEKVIKSTSFYPSPNVDSAVVVMKKREKVLVPPQMRAFFISFNRAIFLQRRKNIKNNLKTFCSPDFTKEELEELIKKAGLTGSERAEDFSFDELLSLASLFFSRLGK